MPVPDHPIHPSTQHGAEFRYGCHSRTKRPAGYYVLVRVYRKKGGYDLRNRFVKDTSSRDCRYVFHDTDPACAGCTCEVDRAYIEQMGALK